MSKNLLIPPSRCAITVRDLREAVGPPSEFTGVTLSTAAVARRSDGAENDCGRIHRRGFVSEAWYVGRLHTALDGITARHGREHTKGDSGNQLDVRCGGEGVGELEVAPDEFLYGPRANSLWSGTLGDSQMSLFSW